MGMKTKDLVVVREGSHLMLSVVMVVRHLPMPIIQARVQGRGLEEDVVLVVLEDWVGGHQLEEHVSLSWPVVQGRSGVWLGAASLHWLSMCFHFFLATAESHHLWTCLSCPTTALVLIAGELEERWSDPPSAGSGCWQCWWSFKHWPTGHPSSRLQQHPPPDKKINTKKNKYSEYSIEELTLFQFLTCWRH